MLHHLYRTCEICTQYGLFALLKVYNAPNYYIAPSVLERQMSSYFASFEDQMGCNRVRASEGA